VGRTTTSIRFTEVRERKETVQRTQNGERMTVCAERENAAESDYVDAGVRNDSHVCRST